MHHNIIIATILILMFVHSGCGATGIAGAIEHTSRRVERAQSAIYHDFYASPIELRVRLNPCACDEKLEFEAEIYGAWRHVAIIGTEEAMNQIRRTGASIGTGIAFEHAFVLKRESYQSMNGQKFYILEVVL